METESMEWGLPKVTRAANGSITEDLIHLAQVLFVLKPFLQ